MTLQGAEKFRIVLGDSNLNIDLPFGVQTHEIAEIFSHEDYQPHSGHQGDNVGLIRLKAKAELGNTVCLLCLPEEDQEPVMRGNCSVVSYGKKTQRTNEEQTFRGK